MSNHGKTILCKGSSTLIIYITIYKKCFMPFYKENKVIIKASYPKLTSWVLYVCNLFLQALYRYNPSNDGQFLG